MWNFLPQRPHLCVLLQCASTLLPAVCSPTRLAFSDHHFNTWRFNGQLTNKMCLFSGRGGTDLDCVEFYANNKSRSEIEFGTFNAYRWPSDGIRHNDIAAKRRSLINLLIDLTFCPFNPPERLKLWPLEDTNSLEVRSFEHRTNAFGLLWSVSSSCHTVPSSLNVRLRKIS